MFLLFARLAKMFGINVMTYDALVIIQALWFDFIWVSAVANISIHDYKHFIADMGYGNLLSSWLTKSITLP